jgi:BlaI family penicillinase repressor
MADSPPVTTAEWVVLEVLWQLGPASARRVAEVAGPPNGWADATVKTLLNRLVEKKAATAEPDPTDGRRFIYQAAVEPGEAQRRASRSFLDRIFNGDAAAGVLGLIDAADLSPKQIRKLRDDLDAAANRAKKGGRR